MANYPGADPAAKTDFNPNLSKSSQGHTAQGHNTPAGEINAIGADLRDTFAAGTEATQGATATSMLNRIGQILQMLKNITGETNWYDTIANSISGLLHATTGHKHTGAADDAPQLSNSGIANDAAIDTSKLELGAGSDNSPIL